MAQIKISQLEELTSVSDNDVFASVDTANSKTKKTKASTLKKYVKENLNYSEVAGKPSINGTELLGNKTLQDLGIQPAGDYALNSALNSYSLITETGNKISLSINSSTYVMTLQLKDKNGSVLSTGTIDLPLETMVVGASYNADTQEIELTLKNGSKVSFSVADLVKGLVNKGDLNTILNDYALKTVVTENTKNIEKINNDLYKIDEFNNYAEIKPDKIFSKVSKLYGKEVFTTDGLYIRKEDDIVFRTNIQLIHKSVKIPLSHYKYYCFKKSATSNRFVIGLCKYDVELGTIPEGEERFGEKCKIVFKDDNSTKTEAWFNSEDYNYAIIYIANSANSEWPNGRTWTLYSEDNPESDDFIYSIDDGYDNKFNRKDNEIYEEIEDIKGFNYNKESLWKYGRIGQNGTEVFSNGIYICSKDYIDENITKVIRSDISDSSLAVAIIKYDKDGTFIEYKTFTNSNFDYKLDNKNFKYKMVIHFGDPLNKELFYTGKYLELIQFIKEPLYIENPNKVNLNYNSLWENGFINHSDGTLEENTNRIRTKEFLDSRINKIIINDNSISVGIRVYDLEDNYIGSDDITEFKDYSLFPNMFKYKLIMISPEINSSSNLIFTTNNIPYNVVVNNLPILPYWPNWKDVRYNYGFNINEQPIFNTIHGVLESDTMISVRGGKGRWHQAFKSGGHVFEGWSGKELCRATMLMGKFQETFGTLFTYSPAGLYETNRRFGWFKFGSDELKKGFDVSQGWTKCYTPFTLAILSSAPTKVSDADLNPQLSEYANSVPVGTMYYDLTLRKVRVYTEDGWKSVAFES